MVPKRKILILGFGGTIAMVPDSQGVLKPAKGIEEILAIVPTLQEMAEVTFVQAANLDSTNINASHWKTLHLIIATMQGNFDGIIVTHGTDTMAYTASAISLLCGRELRIPIVFTGSQLPLVREGTDARFNLENAMKTVLEAARNEIVEVMIVFNARVLRANRTIKISESRFDAFDSPAFPRLAEITAMDLFFSPAALKLTAEAPPPMRPDFRRGVLSIEITPEHDNGQLKDGTACLGTKAQ